jgi:DNA-binding NtrC family response regulator
MPVIKLTSDAEQVLVNYFWPGNIRQLKNIAEQVSIIEKVREVNAEVLLKYLPQYNSNNVPSVIGSEHTSFSGADKELVFKVVRDMRTELNDIKKVVYDLVSAATGKVNAVNSEDVQILNRIYDASQGELENGISIHPHVVQSKSNNPQTIEVEETLSLQDKEIDMIKKALKKHKGKRKNAAKELGISERTLYRKINEYHIEE